MIQQILTVFAVKFISVDSVLKSPINPFPISSSSLGVSVGGVGSVGVAVAEVAGDGAGTLGLGVAKACTGFPIKSSCFLCSNFSSSSISASKTNFLFRT